MHEEMTEAYRKVRGSLLSEPPVRAHAGGSMPEDDDEEEALSSW